MAAKTAPAPARHKKEALRNDLLWLSVLSVIFLLAYSFIFDKKMDLNGDDFGYMNYAKAILDGKGYVSPYSPDFPATNWFPPGYSFMLAVLMGIFGPNIVLLNIVNGILYLGAVLLLFLFVRRITGNRPLAFSVAALLFLNSGLMRYATILMSEIPYLFLSTLAIYCLTKLTDESKFLKDKYFWGVVLGSVGAFYFRSVGLGLFGAVVLFWLFGKQWRKAGVFTLAYWLLYLPWMIRDHSNGLKSRYLDTMTVANAWRPEEGHINSIGAFLDKMAVNFNDTVIKGFTEVLFPFVKIEETTPSTMWVIGLLVLAVTFFGAWKTGKFKIFFGGYLLANIGVFLLWHSGNGSRYVWPLAPFIALCFFLGLYKILVWLLGKLKVKVTPVFAYAFLLVAFLMLPKMKEINQMAKEDYYPNYKNYFQIAEAVKANCPKTTMVCCRKAEMFHFYSGTFVNTYEFSLDDSKVLSHMVRTKVDYVVLEQLGYSSTGRYLYPAIMKHPNLFAPVMHLQNPDTYLLAFDKAGAKQYLDSLAVAGK